MASNRTRCTAVNSLGFHCGHYAMIGLERCQFHATKVERAKASEYREAMWRGSPPSFEEETEFSEDDLKNAASFARAVLNSTEFHEYIMQGIRKRDISASIVLRLMDYAEGWGKPSDKIEHSGKDGQPVVTEIRRTIIHPQEEPTITIEPSLELSDDQLDIPLPIAPDSVKRMH